MTVTRLIATAALALATGTAAAQQLTAAWWNVENYFDPTDDTLKADDDFTPSGTYHWTRRKMLAKRDSLYKVMAAMGSPDVVGLAEVEGEEPLRELCQGTPLRKAGYRYVASPESDNRGSACALLYRAAALTVDTTYAIALPGTRSLLVAVGRTAGGHTVALLLCHWPSRRNPQRARTAAAAALRRAMQQLRADLPQATLLAMGDLNCEASEPPLSLTMGFGTNGMNADGTELLSRRLGPKECSYCYRGHWSTIDHAMVNLPPDSSCRVEDYGVFAPRFMLFEAETRLGLQPKRTHYGRRYQGGYSDHLPLKMRLVWR